VFNISVNDRLVLMRMVYWYNLFSYKDIVAFTIISVW